MDDAEAQGTCESGPIAYGCGCCQRRAVMGHRITTGLEPKLSIVPHCTSLYRTPGVPWQTKYRDLDLSGTP